jgi:hypothetical protein
MVIAVYILCALTSLACAILLVRGYLANKVPLLMWTALCFCALAVNNGMLLIDVLSAHEINLTLARKLPALLGIVLMLHGLIADSR